MVNSDTATDADPLRHWQQALRSQYPEGDAESWDQVGLHVGDPDHDVVTGVLVTLDVTEQVLDEAASLDANLVIAHHPLLFSPLARLTTETAPGRLALKAVRQGCAILAAHTNVDKAAHSTSHPAARVLDLRDLVPIRPVQLDPAHGRPAGQQGRGADRGLGLTGTLPEPLALHEVARRLAEGLPAPTLRLATADATREVTQVGICGGAGDSLIGDVLAGDDGATVEVFVTGDLKHHPTLDALTMGLSLIDAGHFATENPAMDDVVDRLEGVRDQFDPPLVAPIHRSMVNTDPWTDWKAATA